MTFTLRWLSLGFVQQHIFLYHIHYHLPPLNSLHSDLPPWQTTAFCVKAQGSASCHSECRTRGGNRQPINTEGGSIPRAQKKCPVKARWLPRVPDDLSGQLAFSNAILWSDLHRLILDANSIPHPTQTLKETKQALSQGGLKNGQPRTASQFLKNIYGLERVMLKS